MGYLLALIVREHGLGVKRLAVRPIFGAENWTYGV